jgi:hypothetical protein
MEWTCLANRVAPQLGGMSGKEGLALLWDSNQIDVSDMLKIAVIGGNEC